MKSSIFVFIFIFFITGCSATGPKFTKATLTNQKLSTVYLMRQYKFLGAAGCRAVHIDNKDLGCIKNAGYLRIDLTPGSHAIKFPKVTENDWANETEVELELLAGKIYYFEWTHELEDFYVIPAGSVVVTGGETKASIIQHHEGSAVPILRELRESKS